MRNTLYVLAVILLIMWLMGSFFYHIGSAFVHLLLVAAIVVVVINVIRGRRPLN